MASSLGMQQKIDFESSREKRRNAQMHQLTVGHKISYCTFWHVINHKTDIKCGLFCNGIYNTEICAEFQCIIKMCIIDSSLTCQI